MTTQELLEKLNKKYPSPAYAFLTQVRNGTGYERSPRTADAMAMGLWPSRGIHLTGFELKVSRTDWLREVKDPQKAEELAKYCDHWYVVAPHSSLVREDEVPKNWGLMLATGRGKTIKTIKEAPELKPVAVDRLLLAAICRNVTDGVVPESQVQAKEQAAFKRGEERSKNLAIQAQRQLEENKKGIREFEAMSGVQFNPWQGDKIGQAVKEVLDGKADQVVEDLQQLAKTARNIGDYAEGKIERWQV